MHHGSQCPHCIAAAAELVIGAAGAVFAARAAVLAPVRAAAALVAAKTASVETALATDGSASAPAETKAVPVGRYAALKPGGRQLYLLMLRQHLLKSPQGLSKNRDVIYETYVITLILVVGVLTAVILVLANLQTMTDPLILPSRREHPQQSVGKHIEQLRGRDASLRYTCIKRDCCTFCVVWSQTDCSAVVNLLQ